MGAIANTIAIVVIVCVGYLIIKKVYPTAVLMIAGLVLLCCAVLLDVEPGLALKKGTGSEFFDIFKIIQDVFSTTLGGLGLNIMCMGGFAKYMDKLEAGRSLYDVVSAPLKYVKNPYMLAMAGFIVDQLLGMAIPSASGLGLLIDGHHVPGVHPRRCPENDCCLRHCCGPLLRPRTRFRLLQYGLQNGWY